MIPVRSAPGMAATAFATRLIDDARPPLTEAAY